MNFQKLQVIHFLTLAFSLLFAVFFSYTSHIEAVYTALFFGLTAILCLLALASPVEPDFMLTIKGDDGSVLFSGSGRWRTLIQKAHSAIYCDEAEHWKKLGPTPVAVIRPVHSHIPAPYEVPITFPEQATFHAFLEHSTARAALTVITETLRHS